MDSVFEEIKGIAIMSKEKLINLIEMIKKEKIISKKELKRKIMQMLIRNNDIRKINGLTASLLDGNADNLKDKDVESLLVAINDLYIDIKNKL